VTFIDDRMCFCSVLCVCFGFETFVGDRICCMYVRVWMFTTVWICLACSSETGYIPCHCTPLGTGAVLVTTPLKRPGMRRGRSYSRIWRDDNKEVRPRWAGGVFHVIYVRTVICGLDTTINARVSAICIYCPSHYLNV
jgi:hypothetical protein